MEIITYEQEHLDAILALAEPPGFAHTISDGAFQAYLIGRWPGYRLYPGGAPGAAGGDG